MSGLNALDDLCGWANDCLDSYLHRDAMRIADRIETELSERFMELPLDADGVPIHYGDSMAYCGEHGEVVTGKVCNMEYRERSYGEADWLVNIAGWIFPGDARHGQLLGVRVQVRRAVREVPDCRCSVPRQREWTIWKVIWR